MSSTDAPKPRRHREAASRRSSSLASAPLECSATLPLQSTLRELPRCPRNLAVRHAEPDQVCVKTMLPRRNRSGAHELGECAGFPAGRTALSGDDFADAISRPPQLQRQRASQSSRAHNRDARFAYHRRSIAFVAPAFRPVGRRRKVWGGGTPADAWRARCSAHLLYSISHAEIIP